MATGRFVREPSWDSFRRSEASTDEGYDPDEVEDAEQHPLTTIGEVHRALHPLRATADRVGKQVEQFAESLDRLSPVSQAKKRANVEDVLPLVHEYERIATDTVKRLKRHHEPARQELLQQAFRRQLLKESGNSTPSAFFQDEPSDPISTTVDDLNHWEEERQTWQLLGLMIQAQSNSMSSVSKELPPNFTRPRDTPRPHRYSTERDVWNYYLEQNPEMWEKHVVVEWLKSNAYSTGQDIDNIVEQLEFDNERGSDLWAHGWMYTKESIKAQKRLRSWPKPLDPASPGMGKSIIVPQESENVVTQLDPDAFSRQGRELAKKDAFFERATWLACWELVRRGSSWETIRSWSKERVELWRSLSIYGDPRPSHEVTEDVNAAPGRQSRSLWRKTCRTLARDGGVDDYERAVYGALSGDLASVRKVARTWDDLLFAYYNSQILQRFDAYVHATFPERTPGPPNRSRDQDIVAATTSMEGRQVWELLLQSSTTKEEALKPFKLLQGSLIAHQTGSYLVAQAHALSETLDKGDPEAKKLARPFQFDGDGPTTSIRLSNYDFLRVLTHAAFILEDLGQFGANAHRIEQIVVCYVDFLGKAGKQQLLPLYASRLSASGAVHCMARQLPSIIDNGERKTLLNLMHQYNMDVPAILLMQLVLITQDRPVDPNAKMGYPPLRILDPIPAGQSALPPIKDNFLGDEIEDEDWDLINGMEWYLLLDRHWKETMYAGSLVYKYLLLTGSLAAARELSRRVPFSTISLNKTEEILGQSVDLALFSDEDISQPSSPQRPRRGTATSKAKSSTPAQRSIMLSEAYTFRDLEALITALDALENFASVAANRNNLGTDARHATAWKHELQRASDAAAAAMEPLLDPSWLVHPTTPREGAELAAIRAAYLPELILAYITVLGICGQILSRDMLLRGMDIAALVAGGAEIGKSKSVPRRPNNVLPPADTVEGGELARSFVRAGRMAELVDALAVLGRMIVKADEAGARKGRRSGRRAGSEGLGIWTIAPTSAE